MQADETPCVNPFVAGRAPGRSVGHEGARFVDLGGPHPLGGSADVRVGRGADMTSEIALWVGAVALLFWGVGAYNRLVRLRGDLVQRFGPVDQQFRQRHALLLQQLDALVPVLSLIHI